MADPFTIGALLASGASAASGAGAIAATGIAGVSFGTIAAGLGLGGKVFGAIGSASAGDTAYQAAVAASRAELESTKAKVQATELEAQKEKTQAAIEESERQRRLRRTAAAQRANFAGGSIDPFSGSPVAIEERTTSDINREQRLADTATSLTLRTIAAEATGVQAAGLGRSASLLGDAQTIQAKTKSTLNANVADIAQDAIDFGELL